MAAWSLQLLLYIDFKQMMTRRLPDKGTASVLPTQANTLWHDDRAPLGPPPLYADVTRETPASVLAAQLEVFRSQHAVYLNAVPLIFGAAAAEVIQTLTESSSLEGKPSRESNAIERVSRYLSECGTEPFGMVADSWKSLLKGAQ